MIWSQTRWDGLPPFGDPALMYRNRFNDSLSFVLSPTFRQMVSQAMLREAFLSLPASNAIRE